MHYIPFVLLSAPEYIAVLLLTFSIFRIRISGFYPHIILIAIMLGNVSYATRSDPTLSSWSPAIQTILFVVFVWLLFRIPIFYAAIMTTAGYAIYTIIQLLFLVIYQQFGWITFNDVNSSDLKGYILPLSSVIVTFILIAMMKKKNFSMDWIPNSHRVRIALNRENAFFLIMTIATFIISTLLLYWRSGEITVFYVIIAIILSAVLACFIYFSIKKDEAND